MPAASVPWCVPRPLEPGAAALPSPPARRVPMAPVVGPGVLLPGDDMRHAGRDLLVAAGAAVVLDGRGTADRPHHPVLAAPTLGLRQAVAVVVGTKNWSLAASRAVTAWGHGRHLVEGLQGYWL
jgi:hypothetical protein